MKSTVVDESLSSYQPMYCSREYQASTRLIQQYEKSTLKVTHMSAQMTYTKIMNKTQTLAKCTHHNVNTQIKTKNRSFNIMIQNVMQHQMKGHQNFALH